MFSRSTLHDARQPNFTLYSVKNTHEGVLGHEEDERLLGVLSNVTGIFLKNV